MVIAIMAIAWALAAVLLLTTMGTVTLAAPGRIRELYVRAIRRLDGRATAFWADNLADRPYLLRFRLGGAVAVVFGLLILLSLLQGRLAE